MTVARNMAHLKIIGVSFDIPFLIILYLFIFGKSIKSVAWSGLNLDIDVCQWPGPDMITNTALFTLLSTCPREMLWVACCL